MNQNSSDKPSSLPLPSSSPSRWRSDILQPVISKKECRTTSSSLSISSSASRNDDDDGGVVTTQSENNSIAVIIPWSGWYGFFFQISDEHLHHSSFQTEREKTNTNDQDGNFVDDNNGSSRFRLLVSWDNADETTHNERFIPLPMTTDMGTSLTTLTVGRLVYFSQASRVSVVMSEPSGIPPKSSTTSNDSTSERQSVMDNSINSTPSQASMLPQWQLVFQRHLGKTEERSTHDTGTLGELNTRFLMCGLCGKTVSKIMSMKQHQDFVHLKSTRTSATSDPSISSSMNGNTANSIWTRPLRVLYQDDAMVIVVKPQGMAVMGNKETLQRSNLLMPLVGTRPVDWPAKKARTDDNYISNNCKDKKTDDDEQMEEDKILGKPRPAHRLDAPTGGVLVVSKTQRVDCILKRIFRERQCHKVYRAIVHGKLIVQTNNAATAAKNDGDYGICNEVLSGKPSTTLYKPLRYGRASFVLQRSVQRKQDSGKSNAVAGIENGDCDETNEPRGVNDEQMGTWLTVVELKPVTGRHHQLRRHLKGLGHAIVGDSRYGPRVVSAASRITEGSISTGQNDKVDEQVSSSSKQPNDKNNDTLSRLCLWAMEITFPHPVTGKETCVGMDEPTWINHVLKLEQERWEQMQESTEHLESVNFTL